MNKRTERILLGLGVGLGLAGLAGLAAYRFRRHILGWLLHLPPVRNEVDVERGVRIPMPDGVTLVADHYVPRGQGSFPTLLVRSPYGRGPSAGQMGRLWTSIGLRFAERGYHVLIQDTRGRFDSGGEFVALTCEEADGLATLDWLAQQPWYNGVVGMWGPSYLGYCQWAVATNAPAGLRAVVPTVTFANGYDAAYPDGVLALDLTLRIMFVFDEMGKPSDRPAEEPPRWRQMEEILDPILYHLPLADADVQLTGTANTFYRDTLANPRPDAPSWQALDHRARLGRVTAAPLLFSGWYDLFLRDLLADYAVLRAAGRAPYLTVGPWYHADPRWLPDSLRESLSWYDTYLRGETGRLREQPVRLYLMGADEWREYPAWPPLAAAVRYSLHAAGLLAPCDPPVDSRPDHYRYDPADPTPHLGGPLLFPPAGPLDQRPVESRSDVLVYTTPPLEADLDVIGPIRLELYVRSSRPHTDFVGRLCDVYPDGRSLNVCDGLFRVAPGRGEPQPDGTLRVEVDMGATAQRFRRGHRIRLQVASGAFPRWNRNLGLGEPEATATQMVAAEQEVYHDAVHPSALVLPVAAGRE
jgi:putative CocE/NonD family hydrolase